MRGVRATRASSLVKRETGLKQPGPPFAQASPAVNRSETVAFLEPGRYLVICAVLPHFNDKMYGWVEVRPRGPGQGGQGGDHERH